MGTEFAREELILGVWDEDIDNHPEHEYIFVHNGYQCKIERRLSSWTYCGYVQLPATHPDFDRSYDDLEYIISVHGNLTYGENGMFGFDCHHILMADISPVDKMMNKKDPRFAALSSDLPFSRREHYWTFEEVKNEVESLVQQFKNREL